jgi:hypothetical protein
VTAGYNQFCSITISVMPALVRAMTPIVGAFDPESQTTKNHQRRQRKATSTEVGDLSESLFYATAGI